MVVRYGNGGCAMHREGDFACPVPPTSRPNKTEYSVLPTAKTKIAANNSLLNLARGWELTPPWSVLMGRSCMGYVQGKEEAKFLDTAIWEPCALSEKVGNMDEDGVQEYVVLCGCLKGVGS